MHRRSLGARRLAVCTTVALALSSAASAQDTIGTPIEIGRSFKIASRELAESRTIDVSLPSDYAKSTERYPVIIVLDGESQHETAAALTRFYASTSMLPRTIVVGVRNTARSRDMIPAAAAGYSPPGEITASGGADNFLAFIADELVPQIDRRYRTAPMRVLVGHSLGGLFALRVLARRPEAFTGYVVMEPSIWWNDGKEYRDALATLNLPAARHARVMLVNTLASGVDTTAWGGTKPMVRYLSTSGETHGSMAPAGMLLALRTMFADFRPTEWKPGTKPIAMLDRYDSLAARVGYAVPIPDFAFAASVRMSIHAREFGDAERSLQRMDKAFGASAESRDLHALLAEERRTPLAAGFIPLVIPAMRPNAKTAAAFLGSWALFGDPATHTIQVRASGDTIVVHSRIGLGGSDWDDADRPVIQVTDGGSLEWGLMWFRGIAAVLAMHAELLPDGTVRVTREPRGWVPRGPGNMRQVEVFRRVSPKG
ncbi:MAG: alpha/beta hydrolase-fold protein [bacterium]